MHASIPADSWVDSPEVRRYFLGVWVDSQAFWTLKATVSQLFDKLVICSYLLMDALIKWNSRIGLSEVFS
jgi:hypothetical protein